MIEGFVDAPTSIIEKARIAKAAENVLNKKSIVLTRSLYPKASNVLDIYKSFSILKNINWWRGYFNPILMIVSLYETIKLFMLINTPKDLLKYKINNIVVGDLIYDTLIRFIPNSYTIRELNYIKHFRLIFRALFTFFQNEKILNKYDIEAIVTSHNVYAEYGFLCRQGHARGAIILLKDIDYFKCYGKRANVNEHFLRISNYAFDKAMSSDDEVENANSYYMDRISGALEQIDLKNAFNNKKKYAINELVSEQKISNKNVFVMAHAFSDAPHVGEYLLFDDYYDWLVNTLIYLNDKSNLNCFVKSHPSSYMWGEKGVVENIIQEYSLNNIIIVPKDLHPQSIYELADCIITAKGTAGLEFSCNGIPAITAGQSCYSGFGIAFESNSVNDYYKNLDCIEFMPKLNDDVITKSKVLLYKTFTNVHHSAVLPKIQIQPGDDYKKLYKRKFEEVNNNLMNGCLMKDEFYEYVIKTIEYENQN
ncbi:hypothetical protein C5F62_13990 [Photobacterium damselae subsp. damselae]|nr:hypothetical protein C5F62_13990 [Photobacterium damselae subsp. damselae]